ncbi:MAG: hypothetical protein ACLSHC_15645 [Bilophila wadsworthia]
MLRFRNGDFLDGLLGLDSGSWMPGRRFGMTRRTGEEPLFCSSWARISRPLDDGWDARQMRNFDAVAPVGRSGDQSAEEDDFPFHSRMAMFMVCTPGILPSSAVSSW